MRDLIENFPVQITEAANRLNHLDASKHAELSSGFNPNGVIILGMGGSGIGGAFAASILRPISKIPIVTNGDYSLPGWVNEGTLVVACSNSGNTEEVVEAVNEATRRGSRIACIASGGKLAEFASENSLPLVEVPGSFPPRSQFAHSFMSLAWTLKEFNLYPEELYQDLKNSSAYCAEARPNIEERAAFVADLIEGKSIHIYSGTNSGCVATRWRQQLNENSKLIVNTQVFPELNHNELVGWASCDESDVVIIIRIPEDHERTQMRMDLSAEIFQEMGTDVVFIEPDGENQMQRLMDLVFLGDFLSLILAERSGVDPVEIENIERLKNSLAKK